MGVFRNLFRSGKSKRGYKMALDAFNDHTLSRQAMKAELLVAETELRLAYAWRDQRDEQALHRLITAYMRLVVSMAGRFRNYGLPMSDLVQEGNVGLMQAAARFEPEREVRSEPHTYGRRICTVSFRCCVHDVVRLM
jgi:RNA polymerase sigma-32 factor